jgi:hypothetical protein
MTRNTVYTYLFSGLILVPLSAAPASAETSACVLSAKDKLMTLALQRKFVDDNKDSATIKITLRVDQHLKIPHKIDKGGDDGDIHMAGRSDQVRLPLVAEIMNAAGGKEQNAVNLLNRSSGSVPVDVTGVWRIWFEHPPSSGEQIQGDTVPIPSSSNPDHVFEIHPIIDFDGQDILVSLAPIAKDGKAYKTAPAKEAFQSYDSLGARIASTKTGITITTRRAGFNYVSFFLEPIGEMITRSDGLFVLARVYDDENPDEPLTSSPIRMVFVNGSDAAKTMKDNFGEKLKVLGIPRVDLAQVAEIAATQPGEEGEDTVCLPYEMVVLAVLSEEANSAKP